MRDPGGDGSVDEAPVEDGGRGPASLVASLDTNDDGPAPAQVGPPLPTKTPADVVDGLDAGWQSLEHRAESDPMGILSEYETATSSMGVEALRNVLGEYPQATAADLRELLAAHPSLGKVTLAELLGRGGEPERRAGRAMTLADPPSDGWADQFARVLDRQTKKTHTYDSMHELVDRFYLRAVLAEHKTITATARHLKITRVRLRTRLQAVGLYDGFED